VLELEAWCDFNTPKNLSFSMQEEGWAYFCRIHCSLLNVRCFHVVGETSLLAKYQEIPLTGPQEPQGAVGQATESSSQVFRKELRVGDWSSNRSSNISVGAHH
jgi:hypothetical protein